MRSFPLFLLSLLLSFTYGCHQRVQESLSYYPQGTSTTSENSSSMLLLTMTNVGIGEYILSDGLITNATVSNYTNLDASLTPSAFVLSPTLPYLYLAVQSPPSNVVKQFSLNAVTGLPTDLGLNTAASGTPVAMAITPNNALAFVLNSSLAANFIDIYTINSTTGALTSVGGTTFISPGGAGLIVTPSQLIVSANSQYLYVSAFATDNGANHGNFITSFSISGTTLTEVASIAVDSAIAGDINGMAIATTPSGNNILYTDDADNVGIHVFFMSPGGVLSPQSTFITSQDSLAVVADPNGSYLYVLDQNNTIYSYAIDPGTGDLTTIASQGGNFTAIGITADSQYLYAVSPEQTYTFTINNDGTLTQTNAFLALCFDPSFTSPILTSSTVSFTYVACNNGANSFIRAFKNTADVLSLPNYQPIISLGGNTVIEAALSSENNLYTVVSVLDPVHETSSTAIYQMAMDPTTGALSTLASAISITDQPLSATLFNSEYLYLATTIATKFYQYNVTTGGVLTGGVSALPPGGLGVVYIASTSSLPLGSYLYALTTSPDTVYQYSIDESTGALTALTPPTPGGITVTGPVAMIIPEDQTFAYLIDNGSLYSLAIDPLTGQLSLNGAAISITAGGAQPYAFTVTPALSFAYVLGSDANIYQFAINSDGSISALTPFTVSTGQSASYFISNNPMASMTNMVYLTLSNGVVLEYSIGSDGQLSFVSSMNSEQKPSYLLVVP